MIAASVGFAAIADLHGAVAQSSCAQALALSSKIAPLVTGEVGALTVATKPMQLPDLAFLDAAGAPRKLSDWKGRTVLLNLWATWCVPCRKEMPALDNLQGKLGSRNFEVVAVNIDTSGPDKPKAFLKDANLVRLDFFADQKAKVFQDLKSAGLALGMPTLVLVDGTAARSPRFPAAPDGTATKRSGWSRPRRRPDAGDLWLRAYSETLAKFCTAKIPVSGEIKKSKFLLNRL